MRHKRVRVLLLGSLFIGHPGQGALAEEGGAPPTAAYKILTRPEMEALKANGRFEGSAQDAADGFIHLSTDSQLTRTADLHFAGKTDLFVATVDVQAAGASIKWEISPRSGLVFPHLYGVLEQRLVLRIVRLRRDDRGRVVLDAAPDRAETQGDGRP